MKLIMEASRDIKIINKLGMHARAAAKFVKLASTFSSNIDIEKDSRRVNAKSIMGVMMLAASQGTTVTLYANGSDAVDSLDALEQLINDRFDEDE
jgi:phosphocarrier protein